MCYLSKLKSRLRSLRNTCTKYLDNFKWPHEIFFFIACRALICPSRKCLLKIIVLCESKRSENLKFLSESLVQCDLRRYNFYVHYISFYGLKSSRAFNIIFLKRYHSQIFLKINFASCLVFLCLSAFLYWRLYEIPKCARNLLQVQTKLYTVDSMHFTSVVPFWKDSYKTSCTHALRILTALRSVWSIWIVHHSTCS